MPPSRNGDCAASFIHIISSYSADEFRLVPRLFTNYEACLSPWWLRQMIVIRVATACGVESLNCAALSYLHLSRYQWHSSLEHGFGYVGVEVLCISLSMFLFAPPWQTRVDHKPTTCFIQQACNKPASCNSSSICNTTGILMGWV